MCWDPLGAAGATLDFTILAENLVKPLKQAKRTKKIEGYGKKSRFLTTDMSYQIVFK